MMTMNRACLFSVLIALPACGGAPSTIEQPDVDPEAARQPATDIDPVGPSEVPEGADATGVTNPPEEGEDATPVLHDDMDQEGVTDPTPER